MVWVGGVGGIGVLDCCFIVFSVVGWRNIMVLLVVVKEGRYRCGVGEGMDVPGTRPLGLMLMNGGFLTSSNPKDLIL